MRKKGEGRGERVRDLLCSAQDAIIGAQVGKFSFALAERLCLLSQICYVVI